MKFGLGYANTIPHTDPGPARDLVQAAEEAGFESVWTVEHVIWPHVYESVYPYHPSGKMPGNPSIPIPDPLIWLTWVAAATSTMRLATGVMILPQRNPVVLAKETATLDHLTGGRFILGVGVGWLEEEFTALGVPWDARGRRADEMIEAMRVLWSDETASYAGQFVRFEGIAMNPKPPAGRIPVVVGGGSRAAARRAARLGTGFYPGPSDLAELRALIDTLGEECEAHGRPRNDVEVSAVFPGRFMEDPETAVTAMEGLGVDRIIIPAYEVSRPGLDAGMERFAEVARSHRIQSSEE